MDMAILIQRATALWRGQMERKLLEMSLTKMVGPIMVSSFFENAGRGAPGESLRKLITQVGLLRREGAEPKSGHTPNWIRV
jgi:hypothetical protein